MLPLITGCIHYPADEDINRDQFIPITSIVCHAKNAERFGNWVIFFWDMIFGNFFPSPNIAWGHSSDISLCPLLIFPGYSTKIACLSGSLFQLGKVRSVGLKPVGVGCYKTSPIDDVPTDKAVRFQCCEDVRDLSNAAYFRR